MTIGEMDPRFLEKWNAAAESVEHESIMHLNFETESDMDYIREFIADACRCQELNGEVIVTVGTLTTAYKYEHDGS